MPRSVHMVTRYQTAYDALTVMGAQIAQALDEAGCQVNTDAPPDTLLWLNHLPDVSVLAGAAGRPGGRQLIEFFVDHPFALQADQIDRLSMMPGFRLVMACADGLHLLRLRWPRLNVTHCPHGVSPQSLVDPAAIEASHTDGRRAGVVAAGSIHTREEVERLYTALPDARRRGALAAADFMLHYAGAPVEQALDVAGGAALVSTADWSGLAAMARAVTADVNRRRRMAMLSALRGLPVTVLGSPAWEEACTGTIRYGGRVSMADLPGAMARAQVCLAWGPTQFAHSFSERLLMAMAAGCAVVADDRALVRRHFAPPGAAPCLRLFDAARPDEARAAVESLLADAGARVTMASAARAAIAQGHLWQHRLGAILGAGATQVPAIAA